MSRMVVGNHGLGDGEPAVPALARAVIKVVRDGGLAVMGKLLGRLAVLLIPTGQMIDQHDAGEGSWTQ